VKKYPYCGKEYPDGVSLCAIDQSSLESFDPMPTAGAHGKGEEFHGERLIAICEAISKANEECPEYTFGVDRAIKVEFRGQEICLVVGNVGTFAPPSVESAGWSSWKSVYALAESQGQIAWMIRNGDAFKPVRDNSAFPIFWIKQPLRNIA
jgi:hypothetical protein